MPSQVSSSAPGRRCFPLVLGSRIQLPQKHHLIRLCWVNNSLVRKLKQVSSASLICTACGSTSNLIALLSMQCPGTTQEGQSRQFWTICRPLRQTMVRSPRRSNRRRYRQLTLVPSNDGRPSFVSKKTCRAAKSETPAAPFDAIGTLPSSLTVSAKCHFPVIGCRSVGIETRDHASFVIKELYSRCIGALQLGSARASAADTGTVVATNASLCSIRFSSSSLITKSSTRRGCLTFLRCRPGLLLCGCVLSS